MYPSYLLSVNIPSPLIDTHMQYANPGTTYGSSGPHDSIHLPEQKHFGLQKDYPCRDPIFAILFVLSVFALILGAIVRAGISDLAHNLDLTLASGLLIYFVLPLFLGGLLLSSLFSCCFRSSTLDGARVCVSLFLHHLGVGILMVAFGVVGMTPVTIALGIYLGVISVYAILIRDRLSYTESLLKVSMASLRGARGYTCSSLFVCFLTFIYALVWLLVAADTGAIKFYTDAHAVPVSKLLLAILILTLFWTTSTLRSTGAYVAVTSVASWWYNLPINCTNKPAMDRAFTVSFGSLALSSPVSIAVEFVSTIFPSSLQRYLHRYALPQVALHGQSYFQAATSVYDGFQKKNRLSQVGADMSSFVTFVFTMGVSALVTAGGSAILFLIMASDFCVNDCGKREDRRKPDPMEAFIFFVVIYFLSYFVVSSLLRGLEAACVTLHTVMLENTDEARRNHPVEVQAIDEAYALIPTVVAYDSPNTPPGSGGNNNTNNSSHTSTDTNYTNEPSRSSKNQRLIVNGPESEV